MAMSDRIVVAWTAVSLIDSNWSIAVVQEDVAGYSIDATRSADTWSAAHEAALTANEAAGVSPEETWRVLESSMAASRAAGTRWGPRGA